MPAPLPRAIEPLEPRIAPANLVISNLGKTAKWTDVDGDLVTLTSTKPILDEASFTFLPQETGDVGYQLALLDLRDNAAQGASLTFTAKRDSVAKVGDGFVNIGWINAQHSDLTTITLPGDLGRLNVGDDNPATTALGTLTVTTAGVLGAATQGTMIAGVAPTVDWLVFGRLNTLTVKGDFSANLNVLGSQGNSGAGSIGTINILGDLFANDPNLTDSTVFSDKGTGYIFSGGLMGTVKVAGNVIGGASKYSGSITTTSSITSVTIGGSVSGGSGDLSGHIFADVNIGSVAIRENLVSGSSRDVEGTITPSFAAGSIGAGSKLSKVTVGGSVFGGASIFGGSIFTPLESFGKIGTVTIAGSLNGSTEIFSNGGQNVVVFNGIYSDSTLGAVKVGSLLGRNPGSPVNIIAKGNVSPATAAEALAIASVTVVRGMSSAQILAGFTASLAAASSDVQIGPVKVGNNVVGSSISAGVAQGEDFFFGNDNDVKLASVNGQDSSLIRSRIASITVGGYLYGHVNTDDSFAFTAEEIGAVKIGATVIPMTVRNALNGPDDFLLGVTHDFRIREL